MANNKIVNGFDDEKDENLKITLQEAAGIEGCLVLDLSGYIDTYNSTIFQKKVQKAINAGFIRLIFQCVNLSYVSSTGVGSFTSFLKAVKPRGGDLVLLGVQPKVFEVFQQLGFAEFFNILGSLDEALGFFSVGTEADPASVFPKAFVCPACSQKQKAAKPGRFRCSECQAILSVDNIGQISLG